MFITFEGLDFCGKSTQIEKTKEYLEANHKKVMLIREPGGTEISEKIRELLLDKKNSKMHEKTELLLFYASRVQLLNEKIIPKLNEGYFVLSDRFHDSSTAYQGFGRGIDVNFINELNKFTLSETKPDLTFFIDVPLQTISNRKLKRTIVELDRIEISDIEFYQNVLNGYNEIAKMEKRVVIINGLKSIEEVQAEIQYYIKNHPKYEE